MIRPMRIFGRFAYVLTLCMAITVLMSELVGLAVVTAGLVAATPYSKQRSEMLLTRFPPYFDLTETDIATFFRELMPNQSNVVGAFHDFDYDPVLGFRDHRKYIEQHGADLVDAGFGAVGNFELEESIGTFNLLSSFNFQLDREQYFVVPQALGAFDLDSIARHLDNVLVAENLQAARDKSDPRTQKPLPRYIAEIDGNYIYQANARLIALPRWAGPIDLNDPSDRASAGVISRSAQ